MLLKVISSCDVDFKLEPDKAAEYKQGDLWILNFCTGLMTSHAIGKLFSSGIWSKAYAWGIALPSTFKLVVDYADSLKLDHDFPDDGKYLTKLREKIKGHARLSTQAKETSLLKAAKVTGLRVRGMPSNAKMRPIIIQLYFEMWYISEWCKMMGFEQMPINLKGICVAIIIYAMALACKHGRCGEWLTFKMKDAIAATTAYFIENPEPVDIGRKLNEEKEAEDATGEKLMERANYVAMEDHNTGEKRLEAIKVLGD